MCAWTSFEPFKFKIARHEFWFSHFSSRGLKFFQNWNSIFSVYLRKVKIITEYQGMSACPLFPHLLHHSLSASESRTMDSTKHSWENPLGVTHEKNLCKSSYLDAGIMKAHLLRAQLSTVHSRFNCQLRMPLHQNGKSLMEVGVRP